MSSSSLLGLPRDLRKLVYGYLLGFTLRRGFRSHANKEAHPFAWLHTCRTLYEEAYPLHLQQLSFDFATTQAFLDTIKTLPSAVARRMYQIRMIGYLLPLNPDTQAFATARDAINFFPNLQVNTLMVEDYFHGPGSGESDYLSDEMTRHQVTYLLAVDGWRTLQYVSYATGFLSLAETDQVAAWDRWMKDAYGPDSSVTVFVATKAHCPPRAYHVLLDDSAKVIDDLTNFKPWTADMVLEASTRPREVRVLARRGSTKLTHNCRTLDIASAAFEQQYLWAATIAEDALTTYSTY
ncbi:hypothetical protein ACHHYP_00535 [Achlya hypogyna]|uniref:Uncharacterized protein n=1 Tax=Achlya hypogyna TaxID=1202772 RepID=A0A1V9ZUF9_ACHHY|nr:hypothetical protein ACHHYP_00535 [Achlya hypogyna]